MGGNTVTLTIGDFNHATATTVLPGQSFRVTGKEHQSMGMLWDYKITGDKCEESIARFHEFHRKDPSANWVTQGFKPGNKEMSFLVTKGAQVGSICELHSHLYSNFSTKTSGRMTKL